MHEAYFYNFETDEIFQSGDPKDNKTGAGWVQVKYEYYQSKLIEKKAKEQEYIIAAQAETIAKLRKALRKTNDELAVWNDAFSEYAGSDEPILIESNRALLEATK